MTDILANLTNMHDGWKWLILGMLLAVAEVVIPGVFLIWLSAGAVIVGLVTLSLGIGVAAQMALAAILAVAAVMIGRRWYQKSYLVSEDPLLNDRSARMIGTVVEVTEPITNNTGRAKVGDSAWPAKGDELPAGSKARITAVENGVLVLRAI